MTAVPWPAEAPPTIGPAEAPPTIAIFSCVGGGPMARLAAAINEARGDARVVAEVSDEYWRRQMSGGWLARFGLRLRAMAVYPLRAVVETALLPRGAVVVPTTNPFFLPLVMVATRRLHGRRVVPLVYDLYPDALEAAGVASRAGGMSRLGRLANRYWFPRCDALVFIGQKMAAHARKCYGAPQHNTVIETGASSAELAAIEAAPVEPASDLETWCQGKVVAAYIGNMGATHDWQTLAAAVPRLFERAPTTPLAVVIAASGPGAERLRRRWAGLDPTRIRFEGPLPHRAWAALLMRSELALVTLRAGASRTSVPSKTFSAMAAGAALVAVAPSDSDLAALVERHGCGVALPPGAIEALVDALTSLAKDVEKRKLMRRRAREALCAHYDMPVLAQRWLAFLVAGACCGARPHGEPS